MSIQKWVKGDQKKLLALANTELKRAMSPQRLSNILNRWQRATPEQANVLERAAGILGYDIPKEDWIYSFETANPLFKEK